MKVEKDYVLMETIDHGDILFPMEIHQSIINGEYPILNTHWHKHMEISLVEKGTAIYTIGSVTKQVNEGDILIIEPETLHSGQAITGIESENLTLVFDISMLSGSIVDDCTSKYIVPILTGDVDLVPFIESATENQTQIVESLKKIREEYFSKLIGYELSIKSELIKIILTLYRNNYAVDCSNINRTRLNEKMKIKDTLHYLEEHYNEKLYVDDIAKRVGYSQFHFLRLFRLHTGMSFIQYVNKFRIYKSAELLLNTNMDVTNIAGTVGFYDVSYFIKRFKSIYEMTPSNFRAFYRKEP